MIILTSKYTNNGGATFWIRIYDREATEPSTTEFDCGPEFFTLKYEGDKNDTFKRIIPATAQWKILTGCYDYTETQISDISAFYDNLSNSFEGRFYVVIQHGVNVIFRGKILPDVGDFLMNDIGDFVLTAIDGITDLQEIEYRPTGYSDRVDVFATQLVSFNDDFMDIVTRIDTVSYFREVLAADSLKMRLITTANNWTFNPVELATGDDIFSRVMVRNYWFEQVNNGSYRKYKSCWEVLTDLLTGFNAICYYDRGRYYIEQRTVQDNNPEDITYRHYAVTPADEIITVDAGLQKIQHDYNGNDNLWASVGATRGRLPAFKAVELEQSNQFTNYINGLAISVPGNSGPFNLGYVIGTGNKIVIQWNGILGLGDGWINAVTGVAMKVEWELQFKIQLGDFYLKAEDPLFVDGVINVKPSAQFHTGPDGSMPIINWSLIDSIVTIKWTVQFPPITGTKVDEELQHFIKYVTNSALVMESTEILGDGDLIFTLVDFIVKRNDVVIDTPDKGVYTLLKTSRIIVASGYSDLYEKPKSIKRYEIGDIKNSIIYKTKLGYYDDSTLSMNALYYKFDDFPYPIPTVSWYDPDAALALPIQELMMKSILSMRQKPAKIYNHDLYYRTSQIIHFGDQIAMYGEVTVPIDMEMIASGPGGYTTFRSTLWEIAKDYDGINIVDTGLDDPDNIPVPYPVPDGSLDYNSPGGGGGAGVEYWEEWENVSTAYVDVTQVLEVMVNISPDYNEKIKQKWHIYINGVKQRYTPTGTMKIRDWRFDLENNRIIIVKGAGNVAHIELYKYY